MQYHEEKPVNNQQLVTMRTIKLIIILILYFLMDMYISLKF